MSNEQNKLTDEEMEDFQRITADTLANICAMADKYNIDRDSMLKYFSGMLTAFTEVASIQIMKLIIIATANTITLLKTMSLVADVVEERPMLTG